MMKLSISNLIEFRKKSDSAKRTFVEKLKSNKIEPAGGGGDYWKPSISAICNFYKSSDVELINVKIEELLDKINHSKYTTTKNMYKRNIQILERFKNIDLKTLRANDKLSFLKKSTANSILNIKGHQVQAKPSHLYVFGNKCEENIGCIWFAAKVGGYTIEEVGMFCDLQYKFLKINFTGKYELTPKYCVAIDILSGNTVNYSEIANGKVSKLLSSTLDEINNLM